MYHGQILECGGKNFKKGVKWKVMGWRCTWEYEWEVVVVRIMAKSEAMVEKVKCTKRSNGRSWW